MRCKSVFVLVISIFLFGIISAGMSFSENGSVIKTQYEQGEKLQAQLNLSISGEFLTSLFTDSLGNSITLAEMLYQNPDYVYYFDDISNTTISSLPQLLNMNGANFAINSTPKNINYQLNFDGEGIFQTDIKIVSSKGILEEKISIEQAYLNYTKTDISKSDLFVQEILNEFLHIEDIESNLSKLEIQYQIATTGEEYASILNKLSSLDVPRGLSETINTNSIIFYPKKWNINLDSLIEIGGGEYPSKEEKYINAIYSWNDEKLKTGLTFREVAIIYNESREVTLKIFQFEFDKRMLNENAYFIVKNMQNLKFDKSLAPWIKETSSGYFYINIMDLPGNIVFSTTENINFLEVPVFISPPIGNLHPPVIPPYEQWKDNKKARWILFAIIAFILLMIGVVTYSLLQLWYRRKYEVHLFKNRNNLYNIMNYIQVEKKKGTNRDEMLKNLRKAGWTTEQIDYAIRKYEGRKIIGIINKPMNMSEDKKDTIKPGEKIISSPPRRFFGILPPKNSNSGTPSPGKSPANSFSPQGKQYPLPIQNKPGVHSQQQSSNKPLQQPYSSQNQPQKSLPIPQSRQPLQNNKDTNKQNYPVINTQNTEKKPEQQNKQDNNTKV